MTKAKKAAKKTQRRKAIVRATNIARMARERGEYDAGTASLRAAARLQHQHGMM